ncbi:MAG: VanW family protein [Patescibacteria group bacterium]
MKSRLQIIKAVLISALALATTFFIGGYIFWANNYSERIYPGVRIGELDLGGQTLGEAKEVISEYIQRIESAGLKFQYGGQAATLNTAVVSFDSDLSYQTVSFDLEQTAAAAYEETGRTFIGYLINLLSPGKQRYVQAVYTIDEPAVRSFLAESFPHLNISPENAYFSLLRADGQKVQLQRNPEKTGKEINYDQAIQELKANLDKLQNTPIDIRTRSKYPDVKQTDLDDLETIVRSIVDRGDLFLRQPEDEKAAATADFWRVKPNELITWASAKKYDGQTELYFDQDKIEAYLKKEIAPAIDQEASLPRFEISGDRVTSWQKGKDGRVLDVDASAAAITEGLLAGQQEIIIVIKEISNTAIDPENDLKIKEIIGTGHSAFTGSPANRRHNIKVGAAALHGLLIKSGEEFSLIKALGEIDDQSGYLPELVIKGNKTIPEYGGGLCQIGTTVFRGALASGLPITMRQNHSYRVSYYEPAGTDATIYVPQPDFRFVNDTGNYILIQARLIKDDLYFDFWGTKDGRIATTTAPVIYNIVKPGPTKIIETDDLEPGQKKCTESSHNGADAYFDYKVIYPDGATTTPVQERRFKSHYVPWQAVCLVGRAASSTASTTPTEATSSPQESTPKEEPKEKATDESAASAASASLETN